jgi:AbrB family looped-hinge helix DNA binding protein
MVTATVSQKGWIVIPIEMRRKYGIKSGDHVRIVDYGGVLSVAPLAADPIAAAHGLLCGGESLTDALLEEHAQERAHDR